MASDDTSPSEGPKPVERPKRGRHREPPTIEGLAKRLEEEMPPPPVPPSDDEIPPPDGAMPPVDGPAPPAPAAAPRLSGSLAMAVAVLALLVSAGTAYYAWQETGPAEGSPVDVSGLQNRLTRLESAVNKPAANPDQLAALERRVQSLEQRPAQASPQPTPAAGGQGPALGALQSRLDAVEVLARQAATAASERPNAPAAPAPKIDLSPLEQRIASLESRLAEPKTEVRATEDPVVTPRKSDATALAVVAEALSSAVERGRAFPMEAAAAEALGADPAQLTPLKPLAENGAPSRDALARAFSQVSPAVLAAAEPKAASDSLMDRLTASATRLVRVRPVGEAAGEDGPAVVARIEAANARGDAPAALRDWDKLPAPAKAASATYGDLLRKKVAAEKAARTILDGAMSALARPKD